MEVKSELQCLIALNLIPKIGNVTARSLYLNFENASNIFQASRKSLIINGKINSALANEIIVFEDWKRVDKEIAFIEKNKVVPIHFTNPIFPNSYNQINNPPHLIFYQGNALLNYIRNVGVVGTRNPSLESVLWTSDFIKGLIHYKVAIVSGFAYGIDIAAHKASLQFGLPTFVLLPCGLGRIYPSEHKEYKDAIVQNGGFVTEYLSDQVAEKYNFPNRNRLVAGLIKALVIVESGLKGGSMITGRLAFEQNKEVFAVPSFPRKSKFSGCNHLIKSQQASLIENAGDLIDAMGWDEIDGSKVNQTSLFKTFSKIETELINQLRNQNDQHFDLLATKLSLLSKELATIVFALDMDDVVKILPGNLVHLQNGF